MSTSSDTMGKKLGMWFFLFTELFLFGGLFVLYAAYFAEYPKAFVKAGAELSLPIGSLNTAILLVSSFLVAASITAIRRGGPRTSVALLSGALLMGAGFLVNKVFEWGHKFEHGLVPNSEHMASLPHGEVVFYGIYWHLVDLIWVFVFPLFYVAV